MATLRIARPKPNLHPMQSDADQDSPFTARHFLVRMRTDLTNAYRTSQNFDPSLIQSEIQS
jgi:hypothetical protein